MRTFQFKPFPTIGEDLKKWAMDVRNYFVLTVFPDIVGMPFNRSESVSVADTLSADTEFEVSHSLGRIPSGFLLTKSDKGCTVYDSGTTWTTTALYLKCSAANAAITIQVF